MFKEIAGVPMYPFLQAVSWLVFFVTAWAVLRARGIRTRHAWLLSCLYMFCNIVMAKVFFDLFRSERSFDALRLLSAQHYFDGGFWGWLLAFLPLGFLYPYVFRLPPRDVFQALALTLPGVIFVQKLACLSIGCCAGIACDLPWAVVFPEGSQSPVTGVPVHPLQLYDGLLALACGGLLLLVARREAWRDLLLPLWVALYAVCRLLTELLRPAWSGRFSLSQWLELAAIGLALAVFTVARPLWKRLSAAPAAG